MYACRTYLRLVVWDVHTVCRTVSQMENICQGKSRRGHTGFHGKKQDHNLEFFWRGDV